MRRCRKYVLKSFSDKTPINNFDKRKIYIHTGLEKKLLKVFKFFTKS